MGQERPQPPDVAGDAVRSDRLTRIILIASLVAILIAVWLSFSVSRGSAVAAFKQEETGQSMLTAMLDQETGVRGYGLTGLAEFAKPYRSGRVAFDRALSRATADAHGDDEVTAALEAQTLRARIWQRDARSAVAEVRRRGKGAISVDSARRRKTEMDAFRAANLSYRQLLADKRESALDSAVVIVLVIIATVGLLASAVGWLLVIRPRRAAERFRRRELRHRTGQAQLIGALQMTRSEPEAYALLTRHIKSAVPGATTAVFRRNQSHNRLELIEPGTSPDALARDTELEATRVAERELAAAVPIELADKGDGATGTGVNDDTGAPGHAGGADDEAEGRRADDEADVAFAMVRAGTAAPEECLAIRSVRSYVTGGDREGELLRCGVCGSRAGMCVPSVVGGEVTGSVLVQRARLTAEERSLIEESVGQAAPVLANLRNLAIAESRAATDALTRLPNQRSFEERFKAMVAAARYAQRPLAVIAIDLDHFKSINDTFGHPTGNDVLAAVGSVLGVSTRPGDLAARIGGEEFVIVAAADRDHAAGMAERLRVAVEETVVPGIDRTLSASFGIAVMPDDADTDVELMRQADRALYTAKRNGRNRVEVAQ